MYLVLNSNVYARTRADGQMCLPCKNFILIYNKSLKSRSEFIQYDVKLLVTD
jgi:hypothetical protein